MSNMVRENGKPLNVSQRWPRSRSRAHQRFEIIERLRVWSHVRMTRSAGRELISRVLWSRGMLGFTCVPAAKERQAHENAIEKVRGLREAAR